MVKTATTVEEDEPGHKWRSQEEPVRDDAQPELLGVVINVK